MPARTITARRLLTDIGLIEYPVIEIADDGTIAGIASDVTIRSEDALTAAFLDVHTHGAAGHDVMEATPAAMSAVGRFLATRGVAKYLPTTVTAPVDMTLRSLQAIADAIERSGEGEPGCARPIGIHLEGPFISHAKRGVHPAAEIQPPGIALFDRMWEAARGAILLMTIAPEIPGAPDLIRHAVGRGVRVSIGHTNATAAEARDGIAAGAVSATHTYNAMRALDHREPGVLGVVLDDENLFAELICDGVHVAPEGVRLWRKAKGAKRAILVTDAMSAAGMPDGEYTLAGMPVQVARGVCLSGGVLAGSVLTMDRAVANLREFTGANLEEAVGMASTNPAAMLGRPELTRIAAGQRADLNRFAADGQLIGTYLGGDLVSG